MAGVKRGHNDWKKGESSVSTCTATRFMRKELIMLNRRIATALLMLGLFGVGATTLSCAAEAKFQDNFNVEKITLADKGSNTYMILKPGYKLILSDGKDTLTITVLDETKIVDGVRTCVVEERETKGGKLDEVSRNYFAIDKATGDIYYFGKDVDIYDAEGTTKHEGSVWSFTAIPPEVVKLEVRGPNEVSEESGAQYTALAYHEDDSIKDVTTLTICSIEPNTSGSINQSGFLTLTPLDTPVEATINAEYTECQATVKGQNWYSVCLIIDLL